MANYGKDMLLRCDAVLALGAATYDGCNFWYMQTESEGRDEEVELAFVSHIPVFELVDDLYGWVRHDR